MAFIPGSIAKQAASPTTQTGGFIPGSVAKTIGDRSASSSVFTPGSIAGGFGDGKDDLKSSNGLYQLAIKNGLQNQANEILARQEGESTKEIFSGGFISDIFDSLNALQFGVTGLLKGKTFSEGVKTRQSFSDQDALGDQGLPGVVAGIFFDILVDPLTYIAPVTVVKKVPFLSKAYKAGKEAIFGKTVTKAIPDVAGQAAGRTYQGVEGGTKVGKYLQQKLAYRIGRDPIYMKTFEKSIRNTAITTQQVIKFGKSVAKLSPETGKLILKVGKDGRFVRQSLSKLQKVLPADQLEATAQLYRIIDDLGVEAVNLKLLTKAKYEENVGEYLKASYLEFETLNKKLPFGSAKVRIKGIKKRVEELSPERIADRVDNPAYLLMKSAIDLTRDVENAKLFRKVNKLWGTSDAAAGFTRMAKTKSLGELAGKYVPDHMAAYLNDLVKAPTTGLAELERKIVGNFKFFKVVMNPATHARNIISNRVLNWWKLGMNPLDPRTIKAEMTALKEISKGKGKWINEATPHGYNLDTFAAAELKHLLDTPEMAAGMKKYSGKWKSIQKKLGDIYQGEENHAKLTAFIYQRTVKKLKPEDAWLAAESATFNYAQVTPFIPKVRESIFGMPFITFTYKATPLAIETALKHPQRIGAIGKIKKGIENLSDLEETERERATEPPWVKDGFFIKLPMKDSEGRSAYFDLTYILPFGDLVAGNFWERGMNLETGTPEAPSKAIMKKSPFIQLVMELGKNRDFYGNSIWKESDPAEKQTQDLFRHLVKTYSPPLLGEQLPGGYKADGTQTQRGIAGTLSDQERQDQQRTITQEVLRNFGLKVQPIDADIQETYSEWNKKKGLETLLREQGVLKDFNIKYIPEEEE